MFPYSCMTGLLYGACFPQQSWQSQMPSLPAHILYLGQPKDPLIEGNPPPTKHRLAAKMLHGHFFFSPNDCNSFCNLCKGSGQKGAGDGLSLSSCHITKGTAQWGMRRRPQGREIREQRGRTQAWEIQSPPKPAYGNLMNADLSWYAWVLEKFGFLSESCNINPVLARRQ